MRSGWTVWRQSSLKSFLISYVHTPIRLWMLQSRELESICISICVVQRDYMDQEPVGTGRRPEKNVVVLFQDDILFCTTTSCFSGRRPIISRRRPIFQDDVLLFQDDVLYLWSGLRNRSYLHVKFYQILSF